MKYVFAMFFSILAITTLHAQEAARLSVVTTAVSTTESGMAISLPIRCDADQNLFLRRFNLQEVHPGSESVVKFDTKAAIKATFSLMSSPELAGMVSGDYFADADGQLHEIAWMPGKKPIYLLHFDKDGTYKSKTELAKWFHPAQLVVFPKGQALVSGMEPETRESADPPNPFTGLFDSDGKLLKTIALEDDERIKKSAASGDADYVPFPHGPNRAVTMGNIAMGADGNAYLMRRMNPTIIYVISPAGEVVRRLSVDPGNTRMLPQAIHAAKGRLILMYSVESTLNFMVVDPGTGNIVARYDASPSLGGALACASDTQFVFLGNDKNTSRLTITVAEAK